MSSLLAEDHVMAGLVPAMTKGNASRTAYLNAQGYCVLRFWNNDMLDNIEGVLDAIIGAIHLAPPTPHPSPPLTRGGGR